MHTGMSLTVMFTALMHNEIHAHCGMSLTVMFTALMHNEIHAHWYVFTALHA